MPYSKDTRTPAKKNRVVPLGATAEEDSPPLHDRISPPAFGSPGGDKLNQIRKRVKDLSWKDGEEQDADDTMHAPESDVLHPNQDFNSGPNASGESSEDASKTLRSEDADIFLEAAVTGVATAGQDVAQGKSTIADSSNAADANQSPHSELAPSKQLHGEQNSTPPSPPPGTVDPTDGSSDSDNGAKEKSLKRKSRDTAVFPSSETPQSESHKRLRDDPEENPKHTDAEQVVGSAKPSNSRLRPSSPRPPPKSVCKTSLCFRDYSPTHCVEWICRLFERTAAHSRTADFVYFRRRTHPVP